MEKYEEWSFLSPKIWRIMKLTQVFILLCIIHISAATYSQTTQVSVNVKNGTFYDVVKQVEKQSEYLFFYNSKEISNNLSVSLQKTESNITVILDYLVENFNLSYQINDRHIFLRKNTENQQGRRITGIVKDENGEPVIGANVIEKGTTNGVITDVDGKFMLSVSDKGVMHISFIGYIEQDITVGNRTDLSVILKEDMHALDEVVVVGYGTQKKINLTGAVETIKSDRIVDKPVTSLATALAGEAAGVTVTQNSGQPGADQGSIRIRGIGTWGNSSPLVLVDGVAMSMNDVIPNEVESVSVLKDAASAAIYGSRAANGVILVTTKKGKQGKVTFNYTGNIGIQTPTRVPEMVDSWQYGVLHNQMMTNEGKGTSLFPEERIERMKKGGDPDKLEGNTDWFNEVLNKGAVQHSHQIGMNGGTEKLTYMLSAGYTNQDGVIPSASYERYNLRINTSSQLTNWLKMDVNIAYLNSMKKESSGGAAEAYRRATKAMPYAPVKFSDGTWSYSGAAENPVRRTLPGEYGLNSTHNDVMTLLIAPEIKVTDYLNLKGTFGYESNIYKDKKFDKTVVFDAFELAGQPSMISNARNKQSDGWRQYRNLTANATANFDRNFGKHNLSAVLGWSLETFKYSETKASRMDFPSDDFTEINAGDATTATAEGNSTYAALVSGFGRINYVYDERYLLEFTARYDGSSKFARGHRFGFFPSVSGGWRISEESFFEPLKETVQNFKLRVSWGQLGNQNIDNYQYISTIGNGGSYLMGGVPIVGYSEIMMGDKLITWETSENLDFGFDLGMFDNRLNATFDWYKRTVSDILLKLEAPSALGISPSMTNAGEMENKGWELTMNWRSTIGKDFKYNVGFNLSDVKNKVTDLRGYKSPTGDLQARIEGEPLNALFGWETLGICKDLATYDKYVDVMKTYNPGWGIGDIIINDLNQDGEISASDKKGIGNSIPRFTFGVNLGFECKNFDFSVFFQGVGKADGYLGGECLEPMSSGYASARKDQWGEIFDPANPQDGCYYPRLLTKSYNYGNMSHWVQNASYLRLKNLTMGYTFKMKGINNLRVYVSGENLFTITKFRTWDPETAIGARSVFPNVSVYSMGVNLNF